MVTKIRKLGGSVTLVIPKSIAAEMRLTAGTSVEVTSGPDGLNVRRTGRRARRPMSEVLKGMKRSNYSRVSHATLDDKPVGREIW